MCEKTKFSFRMWFLLVNNANTFQCLKIAMRKKWARPNLLLKPTLPSANNTTVLDGKQMALALFCAPPLRLMDGWALKTYSMCFKVSIFDHLGARMRCTLPYCTLQNNHMSVFMSVFFSSPLSSSMSPSTYG